MEKRMGKDCLILSITIDPENDTPAVLKDYAEAWGNKKGWLYLTGDYDEIDHLRRRLGVYDPDPIVDADKTQHAGIVTFGNDRVNRWAALPSLMSARGIVRTMLRLTRRPLTRSGLERLSQSKPKTSPNNDNATTTTQ